MPTAPRNALAATLARIEFHATDFQIEWPRHTAVVIIFIAIAIVIALAIKSQKRK